MKTIAVFVVTLFVLSGVARADSDSERTRRLVDTFKRVRAAPDGGAPTADDAATNAKTFEELDAFFDFATFGTNCLGPSASKLSPRQAKQFKESLVQILRHRGYPNGGAVFRKGVIKQGPPVERAGVIAVPLLITFADEDVSMEVEFVWSSAGRVVDLILDGDSLAKDTRNQVGRIVAKDGADDLLRRVAAKQKEAEK